MRPQLLAFALTASVAAAQQDATPTAQTTPACVGKILDAVSAPPTVPTELASLASHYCLPPSLTKEFSGYSSGLVSWFSDLKASMSECPEFPSATDFAEKMPSFNLPICTDGPGAATTGLTSAAASAPAASTIAKRTVNATSTLVPTRSASGASSTSTSTKPSVAINAAARESGIVAAAAVAALAAFAI